MDMEQVALQVQKASLQLAIIDSEIKNNALQSIAKALWTHKKEIIDANQNDLLRSKAENLSAPLLKRLIFDETKIADVIAGIENLIKLGDPVGQTILATQLDEALILYKVTCPIGVIAVIFESRPDALVQISTLCLKSGNGALLKGGSEARETNRILTDIIIKATEASHIPVNWLKLLETRDDVNDMLKMDQFIDLVIPRGSNEFVQYIMSHSKIPVMGHADGICHCYVDETADIKMAIRVVVDSKTQYVAVCNAAETLLVHAEIADVFLPKLKKELEKKQVTLVGCERTKKIISVADATEADWKTEYLDYKLSIKIVDSLEEAIHHINQYGSGHTDCIVSSNKKNAADFMALVDSGNVFWNCSTRFSDGFRYGFGAEVGVSTGKIHARGPVGLAGLVIYKYKLVGNGQVVEDYATKKRQFTHKKLNKEFEL